MDLRGKKLLILGANPETAVLVKTARDMGVYTVVTDYDHHACAKKFADKACDVDGMDVPGLIALAEAEAVDGVLVGVACRLLLKSDESSWPTATTTCFLRRNGYAQTLIRVGKPRTRWHSPTTAAGDTIIQDT